MVFLIVATKYFLHIHDLLPFMVDITTDIATLGLNLESNIAWILQVLTCKLGPPTAYVESWYEST